MGLYREGRKRKTRKKRIGDEVLSVVVVWSFLRWVGLLFVFIPCAFERKEGENGD